MSEVAGQLGRLDIQQAQLRFPALRKKRRDDDEDEG